MGALVGLALSQGACSGGTRAPGERELAGEDEGGAPCPEARAAEERLPGVAPEHLELEYWLDRREPDALDEELLSLGEIEALNASMQVSREGFYGQADVLEPVGEADMAPRVRERMEELAGDLESGAYAAGGEATASEVASRLERLGAEAGALEIDPSYRVALGDVPFFCAPFRDGFYDTSRALPRDRNRCSTARAQEPVQVLADGPDGYTLARARYTWGYIPEGAALSPPLGRSAAERFVRGPHVLAGEEAYSPDQPGVGTVPAGARLPAAGGDRVYVAGERGVVAAPAPASAREAERPLTRRAVLEEAFSLLGAPYGFGGAGGGRDCSRFLLDVFEAFGIRMPRHSGWQAEAASYSIDVADLGEDALLPIVDEADEKGVVLLWFPGHIMLYLGRDDDGRPMAIHALAEYLEPCGRDAREEAETAVAVERVEVSDLELGRGTSRGALIERVERVSVLGLSPGVELAGVAEARPAAPVQEPGPGECAGGERVLVSPERPGADAPLRVAAALERDPGAAELAIFGPNGREVPDSARVGGPPYGWIAEMGDPPPGAYTAAIGDGEEIFACERFEVGERARPARRGGPGGSIWSAEGEWDAAREDLFSIFVERLFDYSLDEDLTWNDLNEVVRDRERNILYGHLGRGEEEQLNFVPDCAELPYTLRAYFAWKLELPFAYHACTRARDGRPPACERGGSNRMSRGRVDRAGDVPAFQRFVHRRMRSIVHSSAGRTVPDDEDGDFYPVPLTREALRPGATFMDPYGHLIVVASWIPQTGEDYGVLVGADAQPDGTVGMRRFWRGSFLFTPETESGGAGFKAFRPYRRGAGGRLEPAPNDALEDRPRAPFSREQYEGSEDDFYDRMSALINPRPLDAESMMLSLVDALDDEVARRVNAVENNEDYLENGANFPISMPYGSDIFLTSGAWESYSTPSRDWRLLASMDTVLGFPDAVARNPEHYQLASADVDAEVEALRAELDAELASRSFTYERSDGSAWELTLRDVTDRIEAFEMSWNPNDCPEVRWAAPEGSEERATCDRRAPRAQRARMPEYRDWFSERTRPAR